MNPKGFNANDHEPLGRRLNACLPPKAPEVGCCQGFGLLIFPVGRWLVEGIPRFSTIQTGGLVGLGGNGIFLKRQLFVGPVWV